MRKDLLPKGPPVVVGSVEVGVVTRAEVAEARVLPVVEARVLPVVVTLGVVVAARKVAVLALPEGVALQVVQPCRQTTGGVALIHERPFARVEQSSVALSFFV